MSLVARERETYETIWQVVDYAIVSPGEQLVPAFMEMSGAKPDGEPSILEQFVRYASRATRFSQTVLDAGCGSGKGAVALAKAGFRVTMCDLTDDGLTEEARTATFTHRSGIDGPSTIPFHRACLWEPLGKQVITPYRQFDWVYCCDVLEHIPTPFVMLAISRMLEVARRGVFLSIAMQADNFGVWVGKPLHQTVMNFVQWRECLEAIGHVKECRDMLMNGIYLVEPRR